jgi:hypothetical protein
MDAMDTAPSDYHGGLRWPSGRDILPITSYITFGDWRLVLLGLRTGFLWIMDHTES